MTIKVPRQVRCSGACKIGALVESRSRKSKSILFATKEKEDIVKRTESYGMLAGTIHGAPVENNCLHGKELGAEGEGQGESDGV